MAKAGRKALLETDPGLRERIIEALKAGCFENAACDYAGVSMSAWDKWKARGVAELERMEEKDLAKPSKEHEVYVQFVQGIKKAKGEGRVYAVKIIRSAMNRNWQAAAWFLERTDPENYARRQPVMPLLAAPEEDGELDILVAVRQIAFCFHRANKQLSNK